jgi:hypothetical protein
MGNDVTSALGATAEIVTGFSATAYTDATPILSSAIDLSGAGAVSHNRRTILVVGNASCTGHGGAFTVTESATSGGSYSAPAAANIVASAVLVAAGSQTIQYRRNPAKPFMKVTFTGDNASAAGNATAIVVFSGQKGQQAS